MSAHLLILISLAAVLFQLLRFILKSYRSPLRTVSGPTLARFTDAWYFWNVRKGSFEKVNQELHKKHGISRLPFASVE